jgi:hypothetical protein
MDTDHVGGSLGAYRVAVRLFGLTLSDRTLEEWNIAELSSLEVLDRAAISLFRAAIFLFNDQR